MHVCYSNLSFSLSAIHSVQSGIEFLVSSGPLRTSKVGGLVYLFLLGPKVIETKSQIRTDLKGIIIFFFSGFFQFHIILFVLSLLSFGLLIIVLYLGHPRTAGLAKGTSIRLLTYSMYFVVVLCLVAGCNCTAEPVT